MKTLLIATVSLLALSASQFADQGAGLYEIRWPVQHQTATQHADGSITIQDE